jgi:predicted NAD/FAD-dependent oxidoreductase
MSTSSLIRSVAVIGAGIAGAACATSLQRAGWNVSLFDKSRGVGGRMATRRVDWTDTFGTEHSTEFDHGAQHFGARHARFRAVMRRAEAAGCVAAWQPRVHAAWPTAIKRQCFVPLPNMPALARHLLADMPVRLTQPVQRLQRAGTGWQVVVAGGPAPGDVAGPVEQHFDHVVLAMPPAQAAVLLAGLNDDWADALMQVRMEPCWTLMAVTNDLDWPWDAVEPERGPLCWVGRNDRKPGRTAPAGCATWVAHTTPAWSAAHLEDEPEAVASALRAALAALLPSTRAGGRPLRWLHSSVHRWRYAMPGAALPGGLDAWWDPTLGLGICGDFLGGGDVEAAWRSGDELADTMAAWLEEAQELAEAA